MLPLTINSMGWEPPRVDGAINRIASSPCGPTVPRTRGDKWHLDEVVNSIAGKKHWLCNAATICSIGCVIGSGRIRSMLRCPKRDAVKRHGPTC